MKQQVCALLCAALLAHLPPLHGERSCVYRGQPGSSGGLCLSRSNEMKGAHRIWKLKNICPAYLKARRL